MSSFELKSQLFSLQLERMDSGYWILDLAWHLADFDVKGALSEVTPPLLDSGSRILTDLNWQTDQSLAFLGKNPKF